MPLYRVGFSYQGDHGHSGWVEPITEDRQSYRVPDGRYAPGDLDVEISAVPEGEVGYSAISLPGFEETDPANGVFTLADVLPGGWLIRVRYRFA